MNDIVTLSYAFQQATTENKMAGERSTRTTPMEVLGGGYRWKWRNHKNNNHKYGVRSGKTTTTTTLSISSHLPWRGRKYFSSQDIGRYSKNMNI